MTRTVRRAWSPQIAKGFLGAYFVLLTIGGGLLGVSQLSLGERITRVEHTQTVELCSTTVSCRHLLHELIASIGPKERRAIRQHFAPHGLPGAARRVAPHVANRHRAAKRRLAKRRAHRRAVRAPPLLAPAPAAAIVASPSAPAPSPAAQPGPPAEHEPPGQEKKPEHQLCVHLPVAERLLCR